MLVGLLGATDSAATAGFLAAAGIAVITATFLFRGMKNRRARLAAGRSPRAGDPMPADAREKLKRIADRATVHERLEQAMVDAQEAARACAAQIGTRAAKLEALLDQADQRMQRMEQLATRLESLLERAYAASPAPPAPVEIRHAAPAPAAFRREPARSLIGGEGSGFFASTPPANAAIARAEPADPLSRRIYGLADEGLPPSEIAKKLEEQIGKVELILALRG